MTPRSRNFTGAAFGAAQARERYDDRTTDWVYWVGREGWMSAETGSVQRVMAELHWSETRLLDPAVRRVPEQLEALLTDDLVEFGSSGRMFTKQETMVELAARRDHDRRVNGTTGRFLG